MIHEAIGHFGHLLVIISFVSAAIAAVGFLIGTLKNDFSWERFSIYTFYLHAIAIFGIVITLFLIINRHYFEYHYAYNYASKILPVYYQISSFWNGQEGSFLLWMFWNAVLGIILIRLNKKWRSPLMSVFSFTQLFLTSMILGTVVFDFKIGSSPFLLLRDVIQAPIFQTNPDFVPEDGRGLNPLLQNYWMVIHPPTLFLGFAATVIPFAYCIAGLITGRYAEWIRPALPWTLFSTITLGVGILMGAYWAYETLNFGGYWNWDPVENAIYVPWLISVASIHTMIAYKNSTTALKTSIFLVIATYLFIIYSTFLTRSGILGSASVHSFTDLGLQGQLLIYLFVFIGITIGLTIWRWKKIPVDQREVSTYSREFWIFIGAAILGLMAFQVILPTSIPVYNQLVNYFGGVSNMAPPADQVGYYTQFQLYLSILLAFVSGTGQLFWWKKMDKSDFKREIKVPIIITLFISVVIMMIARIHEWQYLLLLVSSIYSIVANTKVLVRLFSRKEKLRIAGGSIAHIGIALMLVGILFSSGYSEIISTNYTGRIWNNEFPDELNQNNLLLFQNEPRQMGDYSLTYRGIRKLTAEHGMVDLNDVTTTENPLEIKVVRETFSSTGAALNQGDTLGIINPENSYFEVKYEKSSGSTFTLYPRVQINETMDMTVFSPDIKRTIHEDLYSHVRTFPDPQQEIKWSEPVQQQVSPGDVFFVSDYVATFRKVTPVREIGGIELAPEDIAVKAEIEIQGEFKNYIATPYYVIRNKMAGRIPDIIQDLGCKINIHSIHPDKNAFLFEISQTQKDWIIIEVVRKPWINILWIGTLLLIIGFSIAINRRYREFKNMRHKEME